MALTKAIITDLTEIVGEYKAVQCRETTVISENGTEISRSFTRRVLHPSSCVADVDSDGVADGTFTHTDTDISGEPAETQAICNAVWTDDVKVAWKTKCETDSLPPGV